MTTTPDTENAVPGKAFAQFVWKASGEFDGGIDVSQADLAAYDASVALPVVGKYSGTAVTNPDATKWTKWTEGDTVYWT